MAITLYYDKDTRAGRVRWLLEELQVPYELQRVSLAAGEHKQPEYLAVHPLGKLPALRVDDRVIIESGAMCIYLADRYADKGLAVPLDSPDRGQYLQWILFSCTTLEPGLTEYWYHTVGKPEAERIAAQATIGLEQYNAAAGVLVNHLAERDYLVAGRFTAADIVTGSVLGMARAMGLLPEGLRDYGRRVGTRPAAKRARAD